MKLLTAGCGISQISFPQWPTWVKYPTVTHELEHINIGGPASGNEFLAHSIIKNLNGVDIAIIMWTEYTKTDLYIESQAIVDEIKTYNLRNFVLNDKGLTIDTAPAWWPSSVSGDNRIKDWINNNIYSKSYQLNKTLINIAGVQRALEHHDVDYYMFLGYDIPLNNATDYGIDLKRFVTLEPLEDNFYASKWQKYSTTSKYGMVPVAGWHWDFYKKYVLKILDKHSNRSGVDLDKITKGVQSITEKCFSDGIS
tara:strand:+ start:137 stop:895 length:759 start_codon:yes stop_codon:yes gene_type:complete